MQKFIVLALCFVAAALAGDVTYTKCGGVGTLNYVRIDGCEGAQCFVHAGTPIHFEGELSPSSSSASLSLKVTAVYLGFPIQIMDVVIEGSSVQAGVPYTVKFNITPNDMLAGNTLPVSAEVRHTEAHNSLVEVCATVSISIR